MDTTHAKYAIKIVRPPMFIALSFVQLDIDMSRQNQTADLAQGPVPVLLEGRGREKRSTAGIKVSPARRKDSCARRKKKGSK